MAKVFRTRLSESDYEAVQEFKKKGLAIPKPGSKAVAAASPKELVVAEATAQSAKKAKEKAESKYEVVKAELDAVMSKLDFKSEISAPARIFKISGRDDSVKSEATAFAIASDWHVEERVNPATIQGIDNSFSPEIAKARAVKFFENTLYLVNMMRAKTTIDNLVLALLGDLITGYIHEELEETNYMSPVKAGLFAKDLIASGIEYLLEHGEFKKIIVPCCVGNHGRTTHKMRASSSVDNSYEFWVYSQLKDYFRTNDKVEFVIATGYHLYLDVYKTSIRFSHGDAISYGGGIGGITVPVNKAIDSWNTCKRADLDVFGHFHQLMDGGRFICNGSLIGYNAYANRIKAKFEPPRQAFFLVDRDHGKTITAPIFLE